MNPELLNLLMPLLSSGGANPLGPIMGDLENFMQEEKMSNAKERLQLRNEYISCDIF